MDTPEAANSEAAGQFTDEHAQVVAGGAGALGVVAAGGAGQR